MCVGLRVQRCRGVHVARIQVVGVDWEGENGHREYQKRGLESRLIIWQFGCIIAYHN